MTFQRALSALSLALFVVGLAGCAPTPAAGPGVAAPPAGSSMPQPSAQESQKTLDKNSYGPVTDGTKETPGRK